VHSAYLSSSCNARPLLTKLAPHEQRQFLNSTISYISNQCLGLIPETKDELVLKPSRTISGAARFINELISENEFLKDHIVSLLTSSAGSGMDGSLAVRRSIIAAISEDQGKLIILHDSA
jgi:telomere length regulation protein